ncbi:MAG: TetR/AcrR family transcriptional regulator, partial [Sciscionella sp.]
LFQRGRGTGEFRTFDDRVMALTLRSAIDTAGARLIADPNLDMAAYTEALQDLFEHAVIAR